MYKSRVPEQAIRKMSAALLSGFWCEIQRCRVATRFERLRWSPDEFEFESGGALLEPGNHIIALFSGGVRVFETEMRVRRTPKVLVAIFAGGLNPEHPNGTVGARVYHGTADEYQRALRAARSRV